MLHKDRLCGESNTERTFDRVGVGMGLYGFLYLRTERFEGFFGLVAGYLCCKKLINNCIVCHNSKSFVRGLVCEWPLIARADTQTFAGCGERPAAVKSMPSKTKHRHSFPNDGAKVLLFIGTDWENIPNFVRILSELSVLCFSQAVLIRLPANDIQ